MIFLTRFQYWPNDKDNGSKHSSNKYKIKTEQTNDVAEVREFHFTRFNQFSFQSSISFQTSSSTASNAGTQSTQNNFSIIPLNASNYCFICQKNFASSSDFVVHIRSHFVADKVGAMGNMVGEEMSSADFLSRALIDSASEELWT